jgi:DNA-binding protein Fis
MVLRALEMSGGNQTRAAELLGMSKQNVSKILKGGDDNDS